MSPFAWLASLFVVIILFWIVARQNGSGAARRRQAEIQAEQEANELRHVVMEMAMERHLLHTGSHHVAPPKGYNSRYHHGRH
jgi:hypothetical protein